MVTIADPQPLRWKKPDFHRLLDVFGVDRLRVELIDGELIKMPPQREPHSLAIVLMDSALRKVFGANFTYRPQMPFSISGAHEPEPDLVVVRGKPRQNSKHPKTAELVVEVADSTLRYDRVRKGSLYASAGLADYWIVNLIDGQLEVRRDPRPDAKAEFGASYADLSVYGRGESVSPLVRPRKKIPVSDLLP
jgi:Uma2 family endonuclease